MLLTLLRGLVSTVLPPVFAPSLARTLAVSAEARGVVVAAENRTLSVSAESRAIAIAAETRTMMVSP